MFIRLSSCSRRNIYSVRLKIQFQTKGLNKTRTFKKEHLIKNIKISVKSLKRGTNGYGGCHFDLNVCTFEIHLFYQKSFHLAILGNSLRLVKRKTLFFKKAVEIELYLIIDGVLSNNSSFKIEIKISH